MKKIITTICILIACVTSKAQLTFVNNQANASICKLVVANGTTSIYEDVDNNCPLFKTFNQVPTKYVDNYSYNEYKMTTTTNTSISKRTYYIQYRIYSGAGENNGAKNTAYVKLTIDYFQKGRAKKVIEAYFTQE
jgi:uncharacterized protein YpuA (DUF1002 family)